MDGSMSEEEFQRLLSSIPVQDPNLLGAWDTSLDLTGIGSGVPQDDQVGELSDWPSSYIDQPLTGMPLTTVDGLVPQNLEPNPPSGLDPSHISPYLDSQPQWQDLSDLNLAEPWDQGSDLPSTIFQLDNLLYLPEDPADQQTTGYGEVSGDDGKPSKRTRIPLEAKKLLEASFEQHRHDPYLQKKDLHELADATGLSLRQVRTFFANARVRKLPPVTSSSPSAEPHKIPLPVSANDRSTSLAKRRRHSKPVEPDNSGPCNATAVRIPQSSPLKQQDPMQRYLSTSPEDEGISEDAISKAAASFSDTDNATRPPLLTRKYSSKSDAVSVANTALSSRSSSGSSLASVDSTTNRGPRRGRKRQRDQSTKEPISVIRRPSDPSKIYQCSFCTSDFLQKYDWRRHEESVHFPQKEWICMPDGPAYDDADGIARCVLCNEALRLPSHFETHNCATCLTNPRADRTFTRKDKLLQHIVQVHKVAQFDNDKKLNWCRPIQHKITITCGICGIHPATWAERADHLATHFAEGHGMQFWIGLPGGIVANNGDTQSEAQATQSHRDDLVQQNRTLCPICPEVLPTHLEALYHKRVAHNYYCITDQTPPYSCPTTRVATPPPKPRNDISQVNGATFNVGTKKGGEDKSSLSASWTEGDPNHAYTEGGATIASVPNRGLYMTPAMNTSTVGSLPSTRMPFTKPSRLAALKASRGDVDYPTRGSDSFLYPITGWDVAKGRTLVQWKGQEALPPKAVGENGAPKAPDWKEGTETRLASGGEVGQGESVSRNGNVKAVWGPWGPA
ncbi:hypothetical protein BU16DRAFT_561826 [Lophium mytilinum]|uniref:Homeobox domain-containing protein n=1 Tax=Lophium mytilinum TaxID=390894 RepID=A0A6A6QUZ6_9PEZI|nr:hypothetical protein BU16DRAFT_561826 [Lophium mytilinum]